LTLPNPNPTPPSLPQSMIEGTFDAAQCPVQLHHGYTWDQVRAWGGRGKEDMMTHRVQ